jgi:3-deoxy-manno-octulosonate cytidylyltransferase (CMP-KDO synthetase)
VRGVEHGQWLSRVAYRGHIGVYLYSQSLLRAFFEIPESPLAAAESLEQLRFLQAGYRILTIEAAGSSLAIDVPEDLEQARKLVAAKGLGKSEPGPAEMLFFIKIL